MHEAQGLENSLSVSGIWDRTSLVYFDKMMSELCQKIKLNENFSLSYLNATISFKIEKSQSQICIDFSNLTKIDTAGVRFFLALQIELRKLKIESKFTRLSSNYQILFDLCEKNYSQNFPEAPQKRANFFVDLGEKITRNFKLFCSFLSFVGLVFSTLLLCLKKPSDFRFISFLYHIQHCALNALGIIALTSLLVGVVLAYQAAYQLQQFGANIFIVDLMGISATRELAPLIAAIVIAGRSASSYTAQIGVMKITDEIAAMNTMGFDSARFIILPRVMALAVAMPLIVAVADAISILGGIIVADLSLGINAAEFMRRFKEAVEMKHIIIGLIKAPVFGFLIGIIACYRGFEVKDTTESIGIYTTKSVVNAIFWVIAFDALFSIILTQAGF